MPVPELEKFRQKFPDYDDLPDDVLAERLAAKYPAYADLPGKVQAGQGQHFGLTGSIPEEAYQRGERNIAGNVFERPAAATRGFIQGLAPGGANPIEGYQQGAINPSSIPSFQQLALDAYYNRDRNARPNFASVLGGNVPSALGFAADVVANPAEVLTAILPKAPGIRQGLEAASKTRPAQVVGEFLTKERFGRRPPQGLVLTEDQLLKMPPNHRARYLEVQRIRAEKQLGRQIGHFEEQARVKTAEIQARASIGEEVIERQQMFGKAEADAQRATTLSRLSIEEQAHVAGLDEQRQGIESILKETAKQKTFAARQPFFNAAQDHSLQYRKLIDQELNTPAAQQARVTVKQLDDMMSTLFEHDLEAERLAHNTLRLLDDPTRVDYPFSPREVLTEIDALALQRGGYNKLRVYTDRERIADDLRSGLLDLLESQGVDFKTSKAYWAPWANVRNKAIRLVRPFEDPRFPSYTGARSLEQVAKGMGPQEVVREVERELGVNLTDDLRGFVSQLDSNSRAKLLAKVNFEARREEAQLASTRTISDLMTRFTSSKDRLQTVTGKKLSALRTEADVQKALAEVSAGRKMTRMEQLQRRVVEQADRQARMQRIMKRSLLGLAAYGGLKQVPVIKDVLP